MQICKGILKDLMESKLNCRLEIEKATEQQILDLQRTLDQSLNIEAKLREEIKSLRDQLDGARAEIRDYQVRISSLNEGTMSKDMEIQDALSRLEDSSKKGIEMNRQISEMEKKLRSVNILADQRHKDYVRVNNSLIARMQMTVKDVIFNWNLNERHQCLLLLLQENRNVVDLLQPSDFQRCPAEVRRDMVKKILAAIKVSAGSWLWDVSELFGCQPSDFYDKVASWYESENLITDEIKYHQHVEQLRGAIEGTDYGPIYSILKQGVALGRVTVADLVLKCAGASPEEIVKSLTGMTQEEVETYRQRRKEIQTLLQTRDSMAAREKENNIRLRNLGFFHHNVGASDPMEPGLLCGLIARIFSRKIAKVCLASSVHGEDRFYSFKVWNSIPIFARRLLCSLSDLILNDRICNIENITENTTHE